MRLPCPQPGLARVAQFYDGHHQKRLTFSKRYEDICTEWLGGLAARPYQSLIERDQLDSRSQALPGRAMKRLMHRSKTTFLS
jgi:hypothetical protein